MKRFILAILMICSVAVADNPYRILNSFNAGELSPLLNAREDLKKYQNGCAVMENVLALPQGGAQKRPGTKYVATAKDALKVRLLPFQFSTSQSYIIEAGNQYMRFFTNNAAVNTGSGIENISAFDNIIGHWLLNDISGTSVVDDDGATHNLVSNNALEDVSVTGHVGSGAFDLDGQYLAAKSADSSDFSFTDSADDADFSLACWAFVTDTTNEQSLITKWRDENSSREWRLTLTEEEKLELRLADTSGSLEAVRTAQWFLDETAAATTIDDNVASIPHDGTSSVNTDTITATGLSNMTPCLDLGGTAYVTITNDHDELSFGDSSDDVDFSLAAWIYVTLDTDQQTVMAKWATSNREWVLYLTAEEKLGLTIADESANAVASKITNSALTTGWHFVVATYENDKSGSTDATAAKRILLYVDSVAQASSTSYSGGTYVAMENKAEKVMLGARTVASPAYIFEDKVDNMILYNGTLLTPSNISALYNSGEGTQTTTGLEIYAVSDSAVDLGWHHLAATYDATDAGGTNQPEPTAADGIILYVDGAAVSSTATNDAAYTSMQDGAEEFRIGAQKNSSDVNENYFADKMDDVIVTSDILTPSEIATLYTTAVYEIETPYLTADLFGLKYEQSADILYITHPSYEPMELARVGNIVWTLSDIGVTNGPFRTQNSTVASTITASATTGSVTLTAAGTGNTPFVDGTTGGHEPGGAISTSKSQTGALFKLVHPIDALEFKEELEADFAAGQVENTSWVDCGILYKGATWTLVTGDTWFGTIKVQRNYTLGAAVGNGADEGASVGWETVFTYSSGAGAAVSARNVSTTGTEDDGDADYRVIYADEIADDTVSVYFSTDQTDIIGIVEITSVTSSTSAIGTVIKTLGDTTATYKWSEGAWSNYRGWPQSVAFFEDRLMFGGNTNEPDTIWGSQTGDYTNFTEGSDDSDALNLTLTSRQVNAIQWMVGKDKLLIGTSGAEWSLAGGSDEPLTPSNVKAEQHSTYGSANLQAVLSNDSVLFFQRNAERMRELAFNWELDSYVAPDMTILAKEVTGDGITDMAFQQSPDGILWCVKENGDMATFSYERREDVTAWSRQLTDGDFESVAVIAGTSEDQVWVSVQRDVNGDTTARYIEYFNVRDFGSSLDDAFFVDSGVTYDSTSSSAMTGLTHLEAETVYVLADSTIFDTEVVSGGAITLSTGDVTTAASTVQMGLPYTVQMKTMPLSFPGAASTIHGKTKRISETVADWYRTGDFSIGKSASKLQTHTISGMTTSSDRLTFPPGYDRDGQVFIYQLSPEPLTVLGIMIEFDIQ